MEPCPGALGQQTLLSFRTKDLHPDIWECSRVCNDAGWPLLQKGTEEITLMQQDGCVAGALTWVCCCMGGGTWEGESCGLQPSSP